MQTLKNAAKWLAQRLLDAFLRELFRFALERFKGSAIEWSGGQGVGAARSPQGEDSAP